MGKTVRIADIRIGARHRKEMGNLEALADSVEAASTRRSTPMATNVDGAGAASRSTVASVGLSWGSTMTLTRSNAPAGLK